MLVRDRERLAEVRKRVNDRLRDLAVKSGVPITFGLPAGNVGTKDCLDLLDSISDTCEATVAELETCFEALAAESDAEVCDLSSPVP